jgi:hypothetical protein
MKKRKSGKSGDRPLRTLDFIGYRRVCPQRYSDGSELSPFAYRGRLAKDGADGYGRCINLNKVKRRTIK